MRMHTIYRERASIIRLDALSSLVCKFLWQLDFSLLINRPLVL